MKSDAIAFGIAGVLFGLIAGWIIGSQQSTARPAPAAQQQVSNAPAPPAARAPVLDETQVTALKSVAEREPKNPQPRTQLANLYFDADRYEDAIKWYDEALELFNRSLKLDPKHTKTLLNVGIVKAFGKQDLQGASEAWQEVIKIAPNSPEAQAAKRALDSLQSAHPAIGGKP